MKAPDNLLKVRIINFMGISNVEIKPDKITQVVGDNNQGKTTLLKAIEFAFAGSTNGQLVKHGEDQAEVVVEIPGHTIRRTLKPDGKQTVVIRDENDFKLPSPQSFLNNLVDPSGFNPLECLEPSKRHEAILKAIDLKVTPEIIANRIGVQPSELPKFDYTRHGLQVIDEAYDYYDKRRTEANRDALKKEEKFKAYESDHKPMLPPETSREDIKVLRGTLSQRSAKAEVELRSIKSIEDENEKNYKTVQNYKSEIELINKNFANFETQNSQTILAKEQMIEQLKRDIQSLNADFESKKSLKDQQIQDRTKFIETTEANIKPVPDKSSYDAELSACREQASVLDMVEQQWTAYDAVEKTGGYINDLKREWENEKAKAETIEQQAKLLQHKFKKELMATVEMPLEGLEYIDGAFMVNGTPIDQLSSALALELGLNIARKLHRKLKIILIDGVERLDDERLSQLYTRIQDDGFNYVFAVVGEGDPNYPRIQMKEGMVAR